MKTTILSASCAIAMVSPLCAGGYTPPPSVAQTTTYESYSWFLGGGGDYMLDAEEMYWNGHLGYNLSEVSSVFLEVGWLSADEDGEFLDEIDEEDVIVDFDIDIEILPITLNYKYEWALNDRLSWYLGIGLGAANIDVDADEFGSDDEWTFMAQAFTGMVYEFTPAFEGYLGLRYMWFDEPDFGDDGDLDNFDDFGVGVGLRLNF